MVLPANVVRFLAGFALAMLPTAVYAQADATASQTMELYAFGGVTGVYTGILDGRNLSITAGVGLDFREVFGLRPGIEIRGTTPIDSGASAGERNVLGGVTLAKRFGRFNGYGDFLLGRGQINYQNGGLLNASQTSVFLTSNSSVFSPGIGLEYRVSRSISIKADAQFQRYATPFSQQTPPPPGPVPVFVSAVIITAPGTLSDAPGHATAKAITLGVRYRFNFNRHGPR